MQETLSGLWAAAQSIGRTVGWPGLGLIALWLAWHWRHRITRRRRQAANWAANRNRQRRWRH